VIDRYEQQEEGAASMAAIMRCEQQVIGAILRDPAILHSLDLSASDFMSTLNGKAFDGALTLRLADKPIDLITVAEVIQPSFSGANVMLALNEMMENCAAPSNAPYYAGRLRDAAVMRKAKEIVQRIQTAKYTDDRAIIDEVASELVSLGSGAISTVKPIKEIMKTSLDLLDKRFRGEMEPAIPTGFVDLDQGMAGGLHDTDLIVIAARPGMGKSAMMLNMVEHALIKPGVDGSYGSGVPVFIASLEMSHDQNAQRLISQLARIDGAKIRTGKLEDQDWPRVTSATGVLCHTKLWIDEAGEPTIAEIRRRARELVHKEGVRLVFTDYLQRVKPINGKAQRYEQVGEIARNLKAMAKELKIPVVALAQLGRAADKERPKLADLRESGDIESEADVILSIWHDTINEESQDDGIREVEALKNRHGPEFRIRLTWLGQFTRFENYLSPRE
jgi:replicative DNA helicase